MHDPGHPSTDYNSESTKGMSHYDIIGLYTNGMAEAYRVLVKGGLLFLKCQDEVSSGKQFMSHIELYLIAMMQGYSCQDLFILSRKSAQLQNKNQKHARKNHSYLWIFKKK